jgi:hypothetical protein
MFRLCVVPLLAFTLLGGLGCGTLANMNGSKYPIMDFPNQYRPVPFGGVGRDIWWICTEAPQEPAKFTFVGDIPLSLVGDVVTLPWATWYWLDPTLKVHGPITIPPQRVSPDEGEVGLPRTDSPAPTPSSPAPGAPR